MSMTKRIYESKIINLDEVIPQDHFLRIIDKYFDWNFTYEEVEKQLDLYLEDQV